MSCGSMRRCTSSGATTTRTGRRPSRTISPLPWAADLAGVDAVVFGHSHKYVQEEKDGVLWLNPGSCGPRRFHQEITMMTAEAEDGKIRVEKVIIPHGTA